MIPIFVGLMMILFCGENWRLPVNLLKNALYLISFLKE